MLLRGGVRIKGLSHKDVLGVYSIEIGRRFADLIQIMCDNDKIVPYIANLHQQKRTRKVGFFNVLPEN